VYHFERKFKRLAEILAPKYQVFISSYATYCTSEVTGAQWMFQMSAVPDSLQGRVSEGLWTLQSNSAIAESGNSQSQFGTAAPPDSDSSIATKEYEAHQTNQINHVSWVCIFNLLFIAYISTRRNAATLQVT
jgi:hypothetical protein